MIQWFKNLFKKKIYLPLWFLVLGRPTSYENFEEYAEAMDRIAKGVVEGKTVYFKVNGHPFRAFMKDGKPEIEKIDKSLIRIEQ